MDSGKYAERVQADYREGAKIGITGTPANILLHNKTGETVLKSGAYPFKVFEMEIVRMLRWKLRRLLLRIPATMVQVTQREDLQEFAETVKQKLMNS